MAALKIRVLGRREREIDTRQRRIDVARELFDIRIVIEGWIHPKVCALQPKRGIALRQTQRKGSHARSKAEASASLRRNESSSGQIRRQETLKCIGRTCIAQHHAGAKFTSVAHPHAGRFRAVEQDA